MYNISVYVRYISKQQDENHRQSTNVYTYNRFHCYFFSEISCVPAQTCQQYSMHGCLIDL